MDCDTREINSIAFGIYSPEEIRNISVCKIDNTKLSGYGSVYDDRMGTIDNMKDCETCEQSSKLCPGHFGHIELNEPILHPLFYKQVISFLKCFCHKCSRLLIMEEKLVLNELDQEVGHTKFQKILAVVEKLQLCYHCFEPQPKLRPLTSDNTIQVYYKENGKEKERLSIDLTTYEIQKIFDSIEDEDIRLLGLDPQLVHPRNFILTVFPVLPQCDRPYVLTDDNNICDDDLTNQIIEIIKVNNHLGNQTLCEISRQKYIQSLKFRVSTFYNNSHGKAKHTTNGRPFKGLKERITGKEGQIRNNLMGKRCEQSGRTVIGPDPTLKFGQVAIPEAIAHNLTIPVHVTAFNLHELERVVNTGGANFVLKNNGKTRINLNYALKRPGTKLITGDIIFRGKKQYIVKTGKETLVQGDKVKRGHIFLENIQYPCKRKYKLRIGDIVERKLKDGDYVLINRQPTLHKGSMMAMQTVITPSVSGNPVKTMRMNLSITKSFNSDFDGDEMNIHVPQSLEAHTELKMLSSVTNHLVSAQSSKPNICIVQDSLLGAYQMTLKNSKKMKKEDFYNLLMQLDWMTTAQIMKKIQHIRRVLKSKKKKIQCFNGRGLVSFLLPEDFNYEKKNNGDPSEPSVKIYKGVMYEGTLNKQILGTSHNSLIQVLYKEYPSTIVSNFIDGIQFLTNQWLLIQGFSIGIEDCLVPEGENQNGVSKEEEIKDVVQKCLIEAEGIKETTTHPGIREIRIMSVLNKAKDIGLRIAKESLTSNNNFLSTVHSGSKGDFFNIAQITGLLGQQNLQGKRVPYLLNHGKRSLPHYPFENLSIEEEYESKGFISNSFITGLNPRQFYFHAMSGREGICDTAMGTAISGYMQRKIVKLTEDIKVQYDGTVRDESGRLYQMAYGDDGLDPIETVKVKGKQEVCDVARLISKLNMKHEK